MDEEAVLLESDIPSSFAEAPTGAELHPDWNHSWWESFEDEDLSRLIETGLASSFAIQQFAARIEQSMALSRQAGSRLYPSLDLTAAYDLEWDSQTSATDTRDRKDSSDLGVLLRWELDVWKRLSSARRAQDLEFQATVEDWLGARLLISSAIAETYFEIKERLRQLGYVGD